MIQGNAYRSGLACSHAGRNPAVGGSDSLPKCIQRCAPHRRAPNDAGPSRAAAQQASRLFPTVLPALALRDEPVRALLAVRRQLTGQASEGGPGPLPAPRRNDGGGDLFHVGAAEAQALLRRSSRRSARARAPRRWRPSRPAKRAPRPRRRPPSSCRAARQPPSWSAAS